MWQSWFKLRSRPFSNAVASGALHPAELRQSQLHQLKEPLFHREGFALLLGAAGMGKTFLLHRLAESLSEGFQLAWLTNARLPNLAALHQALLFDWDRPYVGRTEQELRLAVVEQILQQARNGRPTMVVVDDAQHLEPEQLEEFRLLANLESGSGKFFVTVFAGQAELGAKMQSTALCSLTQQVATRVALEALSPEESCEYVRQQLRDAGGDPQRLLDSEALSLIAQVGDGTPRLLNHVARTALRQAALAENRIVDVEAVMGAAEELGLGVEPDSDAVEPLALSLPARQKRSA